MYSQLPADLQAKIFDASAIRKCIIFIYLFYLVCSTYNMIFVLTIYTLNSQNSKLVFMNYCLLTHRTSSSVMTALVAFGASISRCLFVFPIATYALLPGSSRLSSNCRWEAFVVVVKLNLIFNFGFQRDKDRFALKCCNVRID